ncbi:hypothetical protein [Pseudoduganella violaceinigra]|uniref:hypothetical protein n=1 Tax=Pseudoduganella violaceinigra TaxID=246602 RepID=UPI0012B60311|nr:hypothetical protein [Pseudoduganella violaceinigra]
MEQKSIRVKIRFRSEDAGGRITPADLRAGIYRPHFRLDKGGYLGVVLINGSTALALPGTSASAGAVLIYPGVDYSALKTGVLFDVLEGARIVATGEAIS